MVIPWLISKYFVKKYFYISSTWSWLFLDWFPNILLKKYFYISNTRSWLILDWFQNILLKHTFYISSTRSWLFRQPRETILKFSCVKMTLVLTADPRRLMKGRFTAKVFYSLIYNLSSTLHSLRKHFIKDILNQSSVYLPSQKPV